MRFQSDFYHSATYTQTLFFQHSRGNLGMLFCQNLQCFVDILFLVSSTAMIRFHTDKWDIAMSPDANYLYCLVFQSEISKRRHLQEMFIMLCIFRNYFNELNITFVFHYKQQKKTTSSQIKEDILHFKTYSKSHTRTHPDEDKN